MQKPKIQITCAFLLAFVLTSCVTTLQTNYLQANKNGKYIFNDSSSYKDYRLKEGDKLSIQVYSTDIETSNLFNGGVNSGAQMMTSSESGNDLYTHSINEDGNIQLPMVGDVKLSGKTLRESKKVLEKSIKPILKVNSVDVRLLNKTFSIIGSGKTGQIPFPREKVNIFQAIALAGDIGFYNDRTKVRILRKTLNGNVIKSFNLNKVDIINSEFYYLEPDDIVFLDPMKAKFFGVTTFWTAVSTIITTISFSTGLYGLIVKSKL